MTCPWSGKHLWKQWEAPWSQHCAGPNFWQSLRLQTVHNRQEPVPNCCISGPFVSFKLSHANTDKEWHTSSPASRSPWCVLTKFSSLQTSANIDASVLKTHTALPMKSSPTSSKYFARISYGKDTLGQESKVELASCAGTDWGCKSSHSSVYPSGSTCFRFQVRLTMRSNCTWNWSTGIATLDFFENFSLKWRMRSGAVVTG